MENVFNRFKINFENRFNRISVLDIGEDSIRYDFFSSLMEENNLNTYDIQVEYPINPLAFRPMRNTNSRRGENPQIDLYVNVNEITMTVEFGLFKRNSNPNGNINKTSKLFKMLNDMLRLSLNKRYSPNNHCYFICVADSKMLNFNMRNIRLGQFPAINYNFNFEDINNWVREYKSAEYSFDARFLEKANQIQHSVNANLVYNEIVTNPDLIIHNNLETRVIIYKIE